MSKNNLNGKSLENWLWDAACSIRGIIVSTIHKFRDMLAGLNTRRNIYVMVDEAPRTIGGDLGNYLMVALPLECANFYSDRHCASSMEALVRIVMAIAMGSSECDIAFGVERMNNELMGGFFMPPTTRFSSPNPKGAQLNIIQRDMADDHYDYFSVPIPDYILDSDPNVPMAQTAQNVVEMYDLKCEDLDAMVTGRFTLDQINEAVSLLEAGGVKGRAILEFR